jgi:hypothetical protein
MPVLQTRNRLVNFRLTQDELESLKVACLVKGSRNVSDFARTAVLELIESQSEPGMRVQSRLAALDTRVAEIGVTVQYLAELLKGTLKGLARVSPREPNLAIGRPDPSGRLASSE